jgi:hypothetical protein
VEGIIQHQLSFVVAAEVVLLSMVRSLISTILFQGKYQIRS